ncbi:MAG: alpha/beta hydrolase [Spirulinaceae cyanobacterium RM2_2_10]|nr:alpha/beta hydrolase [Spirulinaceae cyanobacterium SM2_1_0]NJO20249.1 alpha/beta hydrolase [Spirulinaceae cyanobacterium RM2_2_10]
MASWQERLIGDWDLWRVLRLGAIAYATIAFYAYFFADQKIFLPPPTSYPDSEEILRLPTVDGDRIAAIHRPNPDATYTLLYAHGNAEDLGDIATVLDILYNAGFSVFAYDYRGYGLSEGRPSEQNAYEDIDAAYAYLTQELEVAPNRIIAFGRSVGGGSTTDLASRQPVAGLVLESAFTQAFRVVIPFPLLPFDKFHNRDKLAQVTAPVLIIHGTEDTTIPLRHGEQLFAAAPEPKQALWVEGAGHNDLVWVAGDRYTAALQDFAASLPQP